MAAIEETTRSPLGMSVCSTNMDTSALPIYLYELLNSLGSKSHLERDRAIRRFVDILPTCDEGQLSQVKQELLSRLSVDSGWQSIHAGTAAARAVLSYERGRAYDATFISSLQNAAGELVSHTEARVREGASELIGELALTDGSSTWRVLQPKLLQRADANFALDEQQRVAEASRIAARDVDNAAGTAKQSRNLIHETEGWRGLETTLLALAALTRGCGSQTAASLTGLLDCVERSRPHPNRFVREAGLRLVDAAAFATIVTKTTAIPTPVTTGETNGGSPGGISEVARVAHKVLPSLIDGLQDNWSQVRFAASVATRTILAAMINAEREPLYEHLVPRMCLNRHYVAEGVRNYSHETWRLIFPDGTGRQWLVRLLPTVVKFFESQTRADNHAVREASCQSLGEIAVRLDKATVAPVSGRIALALLDGFKDESWPVRDHACTALADVIQAYAVNVEACGALTDMRSLFIRHLSDNITSVRVNCAEGFVRACLAFPDDHHIMGLQNVVDVIYEHLDAIDKQEEDIVDHKHDESDDTPSRVVDTQYGSSTKLASDARHNITDAAHTDQTMYSCGSLAPKLRRGGGCSDHGFVRPREMWEVAEGGILLWRALVSTENRTAAVTNVVNEVFPVVARTIVKGARKRFRHRSKFLSSTLGAVSLAIGSGVSVLDGAATDMAMAIKMAVDDTSPTVSAVVRECRRVLSRAVGLRKFAQLEKEVQVSPS